MPALAETAPRAALAAPTVNVADIKARLGKRLTFEGAAAELTSVLLRRARCRQLGAAGALEPLDTEVWEAVRRTSTLLRSRYTAPAFWRAGSMVFQAAVAAAASPAQRSEARGFLGATQAHLEEAEAPAATAQPSGSGAAPFLFEGLMSEGGVVPPRPLGIQDVLMQLVQGGGAAAAGADADADTSHGDGNDAAVQPPAETPEDRERVLEQLFEHFRDAFGGENSEGLEEALRSSLEDAGGATGPPPAAKSAVRALQKERLSPERLHELGGAEVECSVCREQLAVGEEVQVMPCHAHHVFHTPCLAPWLKEHNSCPVCRFELPTDDQHYERRKQREKTEEEDCRGAANALSHAEFIYQ